MIAGLSLILACLAAVQPAMSHREHKVHNIVLYPDKHSWCKRTPIKQVIGQSGCQSVEVENNVCVGGCFSYSIPRTEPTAPGQVAPYCDSCQPLHVTWKVVTLKCDPNVEGGKSTKRVEVIEECNCMSCSVPHTSSEHWYHGHHHQHHQSSGSADAELIKLQAKTNFTSFPTDHEENKRGISHEKLEILLKVLGGSDDDLTNVDQEALNHILKVITASDHRSTIDHNALDEDDVSQMDGWKKKENLKMDLVKLKEYLATVDHHGDTNQNRHHSRHHIHGPHHSKVLISDDFPNPTLEMEPHHLKPAVGGSEIVYHAESESRGHK